MFSIFYAKGNTNTQVEAFLSVDGTGANSAFWILEHLVKIFSVDLGMLMEVSAIGGLQLASQAAIESGTTYNVQYKEFSNG